MRPPKRTRNVCIPIAGPLRSGYQLPSHLLPLKRSNLCTHRFTLNPRKYGAFGFQAQHILPLLVVLGLGPVVGCSEVGNEVAVVGFAVGVDRLFGGAALYGPNAGGLSCPVRGFAEASANEMLA